MTNVDTTVPSYWLNWRLLLSALWLIVVVVSSSLVIWRYEGRDKSQKRTNGNQRNEAWGTCSKSVHPIWLLAFRITAFSALLALLLADAIIDDISVFVFYTQWTFTLVTIYFGVATSLSIHGCIRYKHDSGPNKDNTIGADSEEGSSASRKVGENADIPKLTGDLNCPTESCCTTAESFWGYVFRISFHICAGAVVLTDCVFWMLLYPFLTPDTYRLFFLSFCMHSVNAVFLLGDSLLNNLRFSFFRVVYFVLWTSVFVVFQWIFHAITWTGWPYPFLDMSSPYAPAWYIGVTLLHLPCFGVFTLVFWIKRRCQSRSANAS